MPFPDEATRLLRLPQADSANELFGLLYDELYSVARRFMAGQSPAHTLQPTALVHEAWIRVTAAGGVELADRERFLAVAASAMRSVLVDAARRKQAQKRDGGERVPLHDLLPVFEERAVNLLVLNDALDQLALQSERAARVVELRFFGGLSVEETAETLGSSVATIARDWASARAWLATKLG